MFLIGGQLLILFPKKYPTYLPHPLHFHCYCPGLRKDGWEDEIRYRVSQKSHSLWASLEFPISTCQKQDPFKYVTCSGHCNRTWWFFSPVNSPSAFSPFFSYGVFYFLTCVVIICMAVFSSLEACNPFWILQTLRHSWHTKYGLLVTIIIIANSDNVLKVGQWSRCFRRVNQLSPKSYEIDSINSFEY